MWQLRLGEHWCATAHTEAMARTAAPLLVLAALLRAAAACAPPPSALAPPPPRHRTAVALSTPPPPPRHRHTPLRGSVIGGEPMDLFLCEAHVELVLEDLRAEYDAVFYKAEDLKMSGALRLDAIEGCEVRLRLVGMYWHSRAVVFDLASHYLRARIPEIAEVVPVSDANLSDDRTRSPDLNGDRAELERLCHEEFDAVVIRHRPGLTFTGYAVF